MQKNNSTVSLGQSRALAIIRILLGGFMIYHGWELFDPAAIKEYTGWNQFRHFFSPSLVVYLGKTMELVSGILLVLGWKTRAGALIMILAMLYICFFVGNGKIWSDVQHAFLFALLGWVFLLTGPGAWSLDGGAFQKNKHA